MTFAGIQNSKLFYPLDDGLKVAPGEWMIFVHHLGSNGNIAFWGVSRPFRRSAFAIQGPFRVPCSSFAARSLRWPEDCGVGHSGDVTMLWTKWMFPKIGVGPQNGWFIMEISLKWMIWGYHYFWKHPHGLKLHGCLSFLLSL